MDIKTFLLGKCHDMLSVALSRCPFLIHNALVLLAERTGQQKIHIYFAHSFLNIRNLSEIGMFFFICLFFPLRLVCVFFQCVFILLLLVVVVVFHTASPVHTLSTLSSFSYIILSSLHFSKSVFFPFSPFSPFSSFSSFYVSPCSEGKKQ